jgi:hypothetical protein
MRCGLTYTKVLRPKLPDKKNRAATKDSSSDEVESKENIVYGTL